MDEYSRRARVMQIATLSGDQPWVATVYFVADKENNLYWLSWPERRHSQEIAQNPKAAITIAVKTSQPVIGIQAEGTVEMVGDEKLVKKIIQKYIDKYGQGQTFHKNFLAGTNHHQMYKFNPKSYKIFDETGNNLSS